MSDDNMMELMDRLSKGGANIGTIIFDNHGTMNINGNKEQSQEEVPPVEKKATKEMMSKAAMATLENGLWKSQRSWAVVFVIYCIWGYKERVSDFIAEVFTWPDKVASRMICNRDAVEKLKNQYYFSKQVSEWRNNGIPEPYCILGEQLEAELENLRRIESA